MTEIKYTHKTRDGRRARILCDNFGDVEYPVVVAIEMTPGAEVLYAFSKELKYLSGSESHCFDLFEIDPWEDVEVDTPINIGRDGSMFVRHFATYDKEKKVVYFWENGRTSHTEKNQIGVPSCVASLKT